METYEITNLHVTAKEPYRWQDIVRCSRVRHVAVEAPEKSGKTFFCRDEVYDFIRNADKGANILYYSPKKREPAKMAYNTQVLMNSKNVYCDMGVYGTFVLENTNLDTALYAPATREGLAKTIASGTKFDEIIVDDADVFGGMLFHSMLLKAETDNAKFIVIGDCDSESKAGKKSIMAWLMNSPCVDSYIVSRRPPIYCTAPEVLIKGMEEFAERIRKKISKETATGVA